MKKLICLICSLLVICLLFVMLFMKEDKKHIKNYMEIHTRNSLISSTEDESAILDMIKILNNHSICQEKVNMNKPDYLVYLGTIEEKNRDQIKIWIVNKKIVFLFQKNFKNEPQLMISSLNYDNFEKIIDYTLTSTVSK